MGRETHGCHGARDGASVPVCQACAKTSYDINWDVAVVALVHVSRRKRVYGPVFGHVGKVYDLWCRGCHPKFDHVGRRGSKNDFLQAACGWSKSRRSVVPVARRRRVGEFGVTEPEFSRGVMEVSKMGVCRSACVRVVPRCAAVDCVLLRVSECAGGAFGVFWARFDFFVTTVVFFRLFLRVCVAGCDVVRVDVSKKCLRGVSGSENAAN